MRKHLPVRDRPRLPGPSRRRPGGGLQLRRGHPGRAAARLRHRLVEVPRVSGHSPGRRGALPALRGQEGRAALGPAGRGRHPEGPALLPPLWQQAVRALKGDYTGIPHNFGNGGKSLLGPVAENDWRLSDTVQQAYQNAIVAVPSPRTDRLQLPAPIRVHALPHVLQPDEARDPGARRGPRRHRPEAHPRPQQPLAGLHARRGELRAGGDLHARAALGHPRRQRHLLRLRQRGGDAGAPALHHAGRRGQRDPTTGSWGSARAGLRFNDFKNAFDTFAVRQPVPGHRFHRPQRLPVSEHEHPQRPLLRPGRPRPRQPGRDRGHRRHASSWARGAASPPTSHFGQWKQNETPFIPWTTNTAIVTPDGAARHHRGPACRAARRQGRHPVPLRLLHHPPHRRPGPATPATAATTSTTRRPRYRLEDGLRPLRRGVGGHPAHHRALRLHERHLRRLRDLQRGGSSASRRASSATGMARTFREAEDTTENVFRGVVDVRGDWIVAPRHRRGGQPRLQQLRRGRGRGAFLPARARRGGAAREPDRAAPLRPGQARPRPLGRAGRALAREGKLSLFASYFHTKFEYDQSPVECEDVDLFAGQSQFCPGGEQEPLGLVDDQYDTFALEANWTPNARTTVYAFYNYEDGDILQTGRQSGSTAELQPQRRLDREHHDQGPHLRRREPTSTSSRDKWLLRLLGRYPGHRREQRRVAAARLLHVDLRDATRPCAPARARPGTAPSASSTTRS